MLKFNNYTVQNIQYFVLKNTDNQLEIVFEDTINSKHNQVQPVNNHQISIFTFTKLQQQK